MCGPLWRGAIWRRAIDDHGGEYIPCSPETRPLLYGKKHVEHTALLKSTHVYIKYHKHPQPPILFLRTSF